MNFKRLVRHLARIASIAVLAAKMALPGFAEGGRIGSWRVWINGILPLAIATASTLVDKPTMLSDLGVTPATATVILAGANLLIAAKDHWHTLGATGLTSWRLWINVAILLLLGGQRWILDLGVSATVLARITTYANLATVLKDYARKAA